MSCADVDRYDFSIKQGDDESVTFRWLADGVPVDLNGVIAEFECSIPALTHIMSLSNPTSLGEITASFDSVDTEGLAQRRVKYKVIIWRNGYGVDKETLFHGSLSLIPTEVA